MKKNLFAGIVCVFLLPTVLHAQTRNIAKILARGKTPPTASAAQVTSKDLFVKYQLASKTLEVQYTQIQRSLVKVMSSRSSDEVKMEKINRINEQSNRLLSKLQEDAEHSFLDWGNALIRERDLRFLPALDSHISSVFTEDSMAAFPQMQMPPFLRGWLDTVLAFEEMPEERIAILGGLKEDLQLLEQAISAELEQRALSRPRTSSSRSYSSPTAILHRHSGQWTVIKLWRQAAQDMADILYILNLYPWVYGSAVEMLASQIDQLEVQTPFTKYVRQQIPVPLHRPVGFKKQP